VREGEKENETGIYLSSYKRVVNRIGSSPCADRLLLDSR
jgi:hypothetical protein